MMPASPDAEFARLDALASYDILDTVPDDNYDAITQIAAQICETPISLITFLDSDRLWFKSAYGAAVTHIPRQLSFCAYAMQFPDQLLEIQDTWADERYATNPNTLGEPFIRFYAGIPLTNADGYVLGTLCVIDQKPRHLSASQKMALTALSRQVVTQLELRRSQLLLEKANTQLVTLNATLQANNQVLQGVVDHCPAGLVLWEAIREQGVIVDFRYVLTNPVNSRLTGLRVDDMIGKTLLTLFPEVTNSGLLERLITVVESGRTQKYQRHDQFNQINIWGDFSLVRLGDGVLFTIQDITRLKQTEEQLRAHTENLQHLVSKRTVEVKQLSALQNAILQHDGLAIISTDTAGLIQTVNPATELMLGYSADELLGTPIINLHDPVVLQKQARRLSYQLETDIKPDFDLFKLVSLTPSYESTLLSRDGHRIPVLLTTTALWSEVGRIVGYVGIATDISALKVAKAELKKKNQELNTFFEVALDLHCIADMGGTILKINRGWLTTMGYTATELTTMNHYDLVHPNDREATQNAIRNISPGQPIHNQINRFRRKDGTYRVVEWNAVSRGNLLYASARDITERQQVERELRLVNQRLELATQAAKQGIWQYDIKQDLLTWDERLYQIHGHTPRPSGMKFQDFLAIIHPDDIAAFHREAPPKDDDSIANVVRIIAEDGTVRYTETRALQVRDKAGEPVQMVGVVWDVTEQKQADIALRQSEERYRSLVDTLNDIVFQADLDGHWTYLNPSWERVTGFNVSESVGQFFLDFVHPDDQAHNLALFRPLIAQEKPTCRHVVRYIHKDGGFRWIESFAQLTLDDNGQPTGLTGTLTDITERKQAEDALRESEQRFREIADNVNEVFWIHSADPFQMLYINPAFERIFDRPAQPLYTDSSLFLDAIVDEDRPYMETIFKKYREGQAVKCQFRIRTRNGLIRWLNNRTFIVKDSQGVPTRYIGIVNDITSQKEKELVLQHSLAREQELSKLKTQFVATASHEFRTPLATIQSSVDLISLHMERSELTAQMAMKRHLGIIEKEVENFSDLLTDILTIGKIDEGKFTFNPRPVELIPLCHDIVTTYFSQRKDNRSVRFSSQGVPYLAYIDDKLLSRVIVNLLSNAFKFSAQDPELRIVFKNNQLIILITDQGIGIPADDLPHLFQTFYRARNATAIQGTGLGLSIARQFVDLHNGQLTVDSVENKGTTFFISLPATSRGPVSGEEPAVQLESITQNP